MTSSRHPRAAAKRCSAEKTNKVRTLEILQPKVDNTFSISRFSPKHTHDYLGIVPLSRLRDFVSTQVGEATGACYSPAYMTSLLDSCSQAHQIAGGLSESAYCTSSKFSAVCATDKHDSADVSCHGASHVVSTRNG
jgi:hypothetical protein